ncbi:Usp family protein [Gordonia effusa NBRC 100432]|uniref:Usp family protein n=1 Tax=Gordonia effusa NBRC 100432 TaxID=1077974 RepID=H0QUR4_9ACTN|nr:universal stress protein [Gordonia effusa]GAB16565.1 Usp family protein [Gordonia effusa NBRC 100432]
MAKFVVGVDSSDASTKAVRWAAHAAAIEEADLTVVCAYDASVSNYAPGLVIPQDVVDAISAEARETADAAARVAAEAAPDLRVSTTIVEGDAAGALLEVGKDATVVVGTRGLGSIRGLLLGSVSISVAAHHHGRSVIVEGESKLSPDGPVVVGVSDDPVSDPAVAEAFRQASLRNAKLIAVHTWSQLDADALHGYGIEPDAIARMSDDAVEALAERMAGYAADYPDVQVERRVLPDDPAKAVVEAAGDSAALIIVGSRGRGGFRGLLLGSTSQKVLHHATCPVMVVRQ